MCIGIRNHVLNYGLAALGRQHRSSRMRSSENSWRNGQIKKLMVPFAYLVPCFYLSCRLIAFYHHSMHTYRDSRPWQVGAFDRIHEAFFSTILLQWIHPKWGNIKDHIWGRTRIKIGKLPDSRITGVVLHQFLCRTMLHFGLGPQERSKSIGLHTEGNI